MTHGKITVSPVPYRIVSDLLFLSIYILWCDLCFERFLYSDEVHIGPETVMTTLYTAKKYAVPALETHCVEFLTKHLRADNAFMLLTQVKRLQPHYI